MSSPEIVPAMAARLVHRQHLDQQVANAPDRSSAVPTGRCQGVVQHSCAHRVTLGLVGVEQARRRDAGDHLGELPAQVH
jgi:hypothetical protein